MTQREKISDHYEDRKSAGYLLRQACVAHWPVGSRVFCKIRGSQKDFTTEAEVLNCDYDGVLSLRLFSTNHKGVRTVKHIPFYFIKSP